jgi:hypothetical protein
MWNQQFAAHQQPDGLLQKLSSNQPAHMTPFKLLPKHIKRHLAGTSAARALAAYYAYTMSLVCPSAAQNLPNAACASPATATAAGPSSFI